jgi:outer membrane receptor protein involved in Fe transport
MPGDVINVLDEVYLLRSSTSIGAFAPAYAPRRTFFASLSREF